MQDTVRTISFPNLLIQKATRKSDYSLFLSLGFEVGESFGCAIGGDKLVSRRAEKERAVGELNVKDTQHTATVGSDDLPLVPARAV
jgi:hypothetical protein